MDGPQVLLHGYQGLSHNYLDLLCLFAVNFHAFDFELEEIALFQGCLGLPTQVWSISESIKDVPQVLLDKY